MVPEGAPTRVPAAIGVSFGIRLPLTCSSPALVPARPGFTRRRDVGISRAMVKPSTGPRTTSTTDRDAPTRTAIGIAVSLLRVLWAEGANDHPVAEHPAHLALPHARDRPGSRGLCACPGPTYYETGLLGCIAVIRTCWSMAPITGSSSIARTGEFHDIHPPGDRQTTSPGYCPAQYPPLPRGCRIPGRAVARHARCLGKVSGAPLPNNRTERCRLPDGAVHGDGPVGHRDRRATCHAIGANEHSPRRSPGGGDQADGRGWQHPSLKRSEQ